MRILLCGLNGCGKSTLGAALAKRLGYVYLDIEKYWFPDRQGGEAYTVQVTREQVYAGIYADFCRYENCILSSVLGHIGEKSVAMLDYAIWLRVPAEVRSQRIRQRSFARFGSRMQPGGDLYESEEAFFAAAAKRKDEDIEAWLQEAGLPYLTADGTLPILENTATLAQRIQKEWSEKINHDQNDRIR